MWKIPVSSADAHLQAFAEEIAAADTTLRAGGLRKRAWKDVDEGYMRSLFAPDEKRRRATLPA